MLYEYNLNIVSVYFHPIDKYEQFELPKYATETELAVHCVSSYSHIPSFCIDLI